MSGVTKPSSHRLPARLVVAALIGAAPLGACSGGDDADTSATSVATAPSAASASTTAPGISEDEAIAAARSALAADDPGFDFDAARAHVRELAGTYDVSFVPIELTGPGGEPHVVIDRMTGEVVETYLTR